jgi:hypothetical protein
MEEYKVRKHTKDYILNHINNFVDDYIITYQGNLGFLLYYPLITIEYRFQEVTPDHQIANTDRFALSWFIGKVYDKSSNWNLEFQYDETEFNFFVSNYLEKIIHCYRDFIMTNQIMDMNSIAKSELLKVNENKYRVTAALIEGGFRKEFIYFHGLDNLNFKVEKEIKEKPAKRIMEKYIPLGPGLIQKVKSLITEIDREILDLCYECVQVDLNYLGGNVKGSVIKNIQELNKIISLFYYFSMVKHFTYSIEKFFNKVSSFDLLFYNDKKWIVQKTTEVTGLSIGKVEKYIKYFMYEGSGSLLEFPLILQKDKVFFIPSSWMLNDFQFSIVNGHYYKGEKFKNREKTISHSVVSSITSSVDKFGNILFGQEVYYEFEDETGKFNSDVDVTLYDKLSNTFLIIESKWKENHYAVAGEEDYKKIHHSLHEIYNEQISKHKAFINNDKEKLSFILEGKIAADEIGEDPNILYIAVDKRSQLFIEDRLMVPLYGINSLFKIYGPGNILYLDKLVEKLRDQKTKASYINVGKFKEFKVSEEIMIVTEDLYLT